MSEPQKSSEELILEVLREVLARQGGEGRDRRSEVGGQRSEVGDQRSEIGGQKAKVGGREESQGEEDEGAAPGPAPESQSPAPESRPSIWAEEAAAAPEAPPAGRPDHASRRQHYEQLAAAPLRGDAGARRLLIRLIAGILLAIVLINIPLVRGLPLARALPDRRALIIRDGLVLKGSGDRIYVLEDNHKRWISSLEAFEHYGYKWDQVHVVDDALLARFPEDPPLHVLLKCPGSPHIYRLENATKRWIKDIPTFEAEGHVWDDVSTIPCGRLRAIPDGPPIPPDAGPPPQP